MITVHTSAQLLAMIAENDNVAVNALLALYERQTADEQAAQTTSYQNGAGFSAFDAAILTSLAEQAMENRRRREEGLLPAGYGLLSRRQLDLVRKKLRRYGRQLVEIATERAARRATA